MQETMTYLELKAALETFGMTGRATIEQINILVQMRNLLTYPYIRERYEQGNIEIFGWYYMIETGEIFNFNDRTETFELITNPTEGP